MRQLLDNTNRTLKQLMSRIKALRQWDRLVKRFIPEEFHSHCQVINLRQECLVIEVQHAAWATRLRYLLPQLTTRLQCEKLPTTIKEVICCVAQQHESDTPIHPSSLGLSEKSIETVQATASNLSDSPLQDALQHLSETLQQRLDEKENLDKG